MGFPVDERKSEVSAIPSQYTAETDVCPRAHPHMLDGPHHQPEVIQFHAYQHHLSFVRCLCDGDAPSFVLRALPTDLQHFRQVNRLSVLAQHCAPLLAA